MPDVLTIPSKKAIAVAVVLAACDVTVLRALRMLMRVQGTLWRP